MATTTLPDLEMIRLIIQLTEQFIGLWGRAPTAAEIQGQLRGAT